MKALNLVMSLLHVVGVKRMQEYMQQLSSWVVLYIIWCNLQIINMCTKQISPESFNGPCVMAKYVLVMQLLEFINGVIVLGTTCFACQSFS